MSKILITGGAGFIGAHVAQELLRQGEEIVILDDFNKRYDPRLKEVRVQELLPKLQPDHLIRGSILDRELLQTLFEREKFDYVIHLAAWAAVQSSIDDPHTYTEVNVDGTVNILELACRHNIKNIVFASSSSVYGDKSEMPLRETDDTSRPISPYAATKASGEILCATWHYLYKVPMSCLRFFTVYGPWGRPDMALFGFTKAIDAGQTIDMRGTDTFRDFTYVDDIVQGVVASLRRAEGFNIFNLGEGEGITLPRFITAIENSLGKKATINHVPLPPGDIPGTLADISLAKQQLNYQPTTSIEAGVAKFVEWYVDWYKPHFLQK